MAVVAKYTERLGFSVDPETRDFIRHLSGEEKLSEAEILRRIIDDWREGRGRVLQDASSTIS